MDKVLAEIAIGTGGVTVTDPSFSTASRHGRLKGLLEVVRSCGIVPVPVFGQALTIAF